MLDFGSNDESGGDSRLEMQQAVEDTRRELHEIGLMIEQSQLEVEKLVQRNGAINVQLQQIQAQFEAVPREDIRATYDAALESQQRLFLMRGQLEKLQSDQAHIQKRLALQEKLLEADSQSASSSSSGGGKRDSTTTFEKLEMMIQAQEAERQRLSQQMHDGPAQALANFILQTEIAMRLFDVNQEKAREELASLKKAATTSFQKVRDFIVELRPMMLDDLGLIPTLKRYIESYKEHVEMDIRLTVTGMEQRFESYLEVLIFRAVQELIGNSARHSQATLTKVLLDVTENSVRVVVEDNGRGFDTSVLDERSGIGIKLIKDRVEMLGGVFEVESAIGQGTHISFTIPTVRMRAFA